MRYELASIVVIAVVALGCRQVSYSAVGGGGGDCPTRMVNTYQVEVWSRGDAVCDQCITNDAPCRVIQRQCFCGAADRATFAYVADQLSRRRIDLGGEEGPICVRIVARHAMPVADPMAEGVQRCDCLTTFDDLGDEPWAMCVHTAEGTSDGQLRLVGTPAAAGSFDRCLGVYRTARCAAPRSDGGE